MMNWAIHGNAAIPGLSKYLSCIFIHVAAYRMLPFEKTMQKTYYYRQVSFSNRKSICSLQLVHFSFWMMFYV